MEATRRIIENAMGRRSAGVFSESSVLTLAFEFEVSLRRQPSKEIADSKALARLMISLRPPGDFSDEAWKKCVEAARRFAYELSVTYEGSRAQLMRLIGRRAGMTPLGLSIVPVQQADGTLRNKIVADEVSGFLGYAAALLRDPERDFGKRLRRCALPECGKYFLQPEKVRKRVYCSDEHRDEAHDAQGPERVAASRARMSVKDYRKKGRKHK